MSKQNNEYLTRAILIADYILEDGGHTISETAKEFRVSRSTIRRDLNLLGSVAFFGNHPNTTELQIKYAKTMKVLNGRSKKK